MTPPEVSDARIDLNRALRAIMPRRAQAVVWRARGWTYREIAAELGVGPQRAQQIVATGHRNLREVMAYKILRKRFEGDTT